MKSLLKNRSFVTLISAQFAEQVGDSIALMTLIAWAASLKSQAGSSTAQVSLLLLFIGVPIILLGPFAGVVVDRLKKKTMMLIATAWKGSAVVLAFLALSRQASPYIVYALALLFSAGAQFFLPAKSSLIPLLVKKQELLRANSLSAVTTVVVLLIGFATAGFIIDTVGFHKTLYISIAAYALTLGLVLAIRSGEKVASANVTFAKVWSEFTYGLAHLFDNEKIKFVVRRVAVLMIIIGLFFVSLSGKFLGVILDKTGVGLENNKAMGIMFAALGMSLVAGALLIEKAVKVLKEMTLIRILFPVLGCGVLGLYLWPNYYYLLATGMLAGVGGAMILGLAETIIQENTKGGLRGRLFAAYYFVRNSSTTIGTTLAGLLAARVNEPEIVAACGAVLIIYGGVNFFVKIGGTGKKAAGRRS